MKIQIRALVEEIKREVMKVKESKPNLGKELDHINSAIFE